MKALAAAVSRKDINKGIAELGVDATEHMRMCIEAIGVADTLYEKESLVRFVLKKLL